MLDIVEQMIDKHVDELKESRFIIVQHLLSDTRDFILLLLERGIEVVHVFGKSYSYEKEVYDELNKYIPVSLVEDGTKKCESVLYKAVSLSQVDRKSIVVLDLGGEYAELLSVIDTRGIDVYVVEDTAYGHRKYEQSIILNPYVKVYSVAKSTFKEIEAKFVGESIVSSAEFIFRTLGSTLCGKKVLVVGYGMIGKNVANALRLSKCKTAVFDIDEIKMCHAHYDGHLIGKLNELCEWSNVIIGTTGTTSIAYENIADLSHDIVLISGSSKQVEFSKDIFCECNKSDIGKYIQSFTYNNKQVYLFNEGFPVNFITKSIPNCIIEYLFAEMLTCIVDARTSMKCNRILSSSDKGVNEVASLIIMREENMRLI